MPDRATVANLRPYTPKELDAVAKQLADKYVAAERDLLKILADGSITDWKRAFTQQQIAQIRAVTDGLTQSAAYWTETHVPELYKHGLWVSDASHAVAGDSRFLQPGGLSKYAHPGDWTPMDLGMTRMHDVAVRELAENAALRLSEANSYCAQRIESMIARTQALGQLPSTRDARFAISQVQWGIRDASLDAMTQAFAQGETMREAQRRLLSELRDRGITTFTDRAGRDWDMERYAQMVARTVAQEAQTHGLVNRMAEIGEDVVEVIGQSVDEKDDVCDEYEGQLLSISGRTVGEIYEGREVIASVDEARADGLLHPGCVHDLVPFIA